MVSHSSNRANLGASHPQRWNNSMSTSQPQAWRLSRQAPSAPASHGSKATRRSGKATGPPTLAAVASNPGSVAGAGQSGPDDGETSATGPPSTGAAGCRRENRSVPPAPSRRPDRSPPRPAAGGRTTGRRRTATRQNGQPSAGSADRARVNITTSVRVNTRTRRPSADAAPGVNHTRSA